MKIRYDPIGGFTQPDEQVEAQYQEHLRHKDVVRYVPTVGSMLMVTRFRLGRAEGDIDELIVQVNNVDYVCDLEGGIAQGFWASITDHNINYLMRLLDARPYAEGV